MSFLRKLKNSVVQYIRNTDRLLILLCLLASAYGVALVYSATYTRGPQSFIRQLAASAVGIVLAIIISKFDYENIVGLWPVWAGISLILVILTLTPLGLQVSGTDDKAWLSVPVFGTFQPSELMKIAFIITFAKHLTYVRERINRPLTLLLVCLHGALPILLVVKQGDDGTALVFMFIFAAMIFAAGLKPVYILSAAIAVLAAIPLVWNMLADDKKERFLCLFQVDQYYMDRGWQQYLGLTALGSGQLWGVGYKEGGQQQMLYARNNDFVFTVAGEEFGFIGSIVLLLLIVLILAVILRDAMQARDRLGMFLCTGMMSMIGFQSLINIGMTLRLLPVIGITLPFFSAGGSSVLTLYLGIGLVLSVRYSSRTRTREGIFYKKL